MSAVRPLRPFLTAALLVAALWVSFTPSQNVAQAAVVHRLGYHGSVDGYTSWYGSYGMGTLGSGWCIDHGIRAPDPALAYEPTDPDVSEETRTAMAWLVGRHGFNADRVTTAAMMLALHDLMGANYPSGRLNVDTLGPSRLAGFGGDEVAVIIRARELKAEALRRSVLRGPFSLALATDSAPVGDHGVLRGRVTDALGQPVANASVLASSPNSRLDQSQIDTGGDGTFRLRYDVTSPVTSFDVLAVLPDLDLSAYAPTVSRAQRVIVPHHVLLEGDVSVEAIAAPPGALTIIKVDRTTDEPLAGATFDLVRGEPTGPDSVVVETVQTELEPTTIADLNYGTYWLIERVAPTNHVLDPTPIEVQVVPGETVSVVVTNDRVVPDVTPPSTTSTVVPTPTTSAPVTTSLPVSAVPSAAPADAPRTSAPTQRPELPRTGNTTIPTALIGAGLVFIGAAVTIGADIGPDGRLRPSRRRRRPIRRARARNSGGARRTRRSTRPPSGDRR